MQNLEGVCFEVAATAWFAYLGVYMFAHPMSTFMLKPVFISVLLIYLRVSIIAKMLFVILFG